MSMILINRTEIVIRTILCPSKLIKIGQKTYFCFFSLHFIQFIKVSENQTQQSHIYKNLPSKQLDLVRIPETKKDSLFCARTHLKEKYIYKCHTAKTKQYSWCHRQTILDLSVKKWRAPDSFFFSIYICTQSTWLQTKTTPTGRINFVVLFSYPISGKETKINLVLAFSLFVLIYLCYECMMVVFNYWYINQKWNNWFILSMRQSFNYSIHWFQKWFNFW